MSDDQVVVGQNYLAEGVSDLLKAKNHMEQLKSDMINDLGRQLESWDSDGLGAAPKQAYEKVLQVWNQSMQDMESIANNMGSSLGQISENYKFNEARVEGMW